MARRRTHIIEGEHQAGIVTALCGRKLATRADAFLAAMAMPTDEYLDAIRGVVIPDSTLDCNWITVEQFADGDDSPDCAPCRKALDAALVRYWSGGEETAGKGESDG